MVKKLSAAGELAKLAGSREARIEAQRKESERQTQTEFEKGTLDAGYAKRRGEQDIAAGIDSDYSVAERIRRGTISEHELEDALASGKVNADAVLRRFGIVTGPKNYTVELTENLNLGSGREETSPKTQPRTLYESYQERTYPQEFFDTKTVTFQSEKGGKKKAIVKSPKEIKSQGKKGSVLERGLAVTASEAADVVANLEQSYGNYGFGLNTGIGENLAKAKDYKEAFKILGIDETKYASPKDAKKPQRSRSQSQSYYAGMYANPDFDVDAKTKGVQPYYGITDYTPPVVGKEDRSAQYRTEEFLQAGGALQEPLSPEKKAYYSQPRESRGPNPFKQTSFLGQFYEEKTKPERDARLEVLSNLSRESERILGGSAGIGISVRDPERFSGSSQRIITVKERALGQSGTMEDIPFVEAKGTSGAIFYDGKQYANLGEAVSERQKMRDEKIAQAYLLTQENREKSSQKFGQINESGLPKKLQPKFQTGEEAKLSGQQRTVFEESTIPFILGSEFRQSPIPSKIAKKLGKEPASDERFAIDTTFLPSSIIPDASQPQKTKADPYLVVPATDRSYFDAEKSLFELMQYEESAPREQQNALAEIYLGAKDAGYNFLAGLTNIPADLGFGSQEKKLPIITTPIQLSIELREKQAGIYGAWSQGLISDAQRDIELAKVEQIQQQENKKLFEKSPIRAGTAGIIGVAEYASIPVTGGAGAVRGGITLITKAKPFLGSLGKLTRPQSAIVGTGRQTLKEALTTERKQYEKMPTALQQIQSTLAKGLPIDSKLAKKGKDALYKEGKRLKYEQFEEIPPSLSPEQQVRISINMYRDLQRIESNRMQKIGEFLKEKKIPLDNALQRASEFSPQNKRLAELSESARYRGLNPQEKLMAEKLLRENDIKLTKDFQDYLIKSRPKSNPADDIFGDFSETQGKGAARTPYEEVGIPSSGAKLLKFGETGGSGGSPKVTVSSDYYGGRLGKYLPFIGGGSATATGFYLGEDSKKEKQREKFSSFGNIQEIEAAQNQAQRLFQEPQSRQGQKEKQKRGQDVFLAYLQEFETGQKTGQKQRQSQTYRINVPQVPDLYTDVPLTSITPALLQEDEPKIPTTKDTFSLLRFGGFGFDSAYGESDYNKFFRVYDVPKQPFAKTRRYLGYYEDSPIPNYEIMAYDRIPLGLARPRAIQDEYTFIEDFLGQRTKKSRKKNR